jgi:hypothetical protein
VENGSLLLVKCVQFWQGVREVHHDAQMPSRSRGQSTPRRSFRFRLLQVCERMGKDHRIRRLYCRTCGHRFSERQGSLMARSKLPEETVVRIVKCLGYGCSVEATADICEVDPRTVELLLSKAGPRAEDFHCLQLERLSEPIQAVEIDELHAPVAGPKKGRHPVLALLADLVGDEAARGFTWPWRRHSDS